MRGFWNWKPVTTPEEVFNDPRWEKDPVRLFGEVARELGIEEARVVFRGAHRLERLSKGSR